MQESTRVPTSCPHLRCQAGNCEHSPPSSHPGWGARISPGWSQHSPQYRSLLWKQRPTGHRLGARDGTQVSSWAPKPGVGGEDHCESPSRLDVASPGTPAKNREAQGEAGPRTLPPNPPASLCSAASHPRALERAYGVRQSPQPPSTTGLRRMASPRVPTPRDSQ